MGPPARPAVNRVVLVSISWPDRTTYGVNVRISCPLQPATLVAQGQVSATKSRKITSRTIAYGILADGTESRTASSAPAHLPCVRETSWGSAGWGLPRFCAKLWRCKGWRLPCFQIRRCCVRPVRRSPRLVPAASRQGPKRSDDGCFAALGSVLWTALRQAGAPPERAIRHQHYSTFPPFCAEIASRKS